VNSNPIIDRDIDLLFSLLLHIAPVKTESLARSKLLKNSHLIGVLEFFAERETGSGQVTISGFPNFYKWQEGVGHPDMALIHSLAPLPSYDVYSLRRTLRDNAIAVHNYDDLKLSPEKNKELIGCMSKFTLPLTRQVYGGDSKDIRNFENLVRMFKDPHLKEALAQLKKWRKIENHG